jgi:stage V sporulation protein R
MQYLTEEHARELNLFTYSPKGRKNPDWSIDDVVDEEGWPEVRQALISSIGSNSIPVIYVNELKDRTLILQHEHDGRDLELDYADNCVKNISKLWKDKVKLFTVLENDIFEF